MEQPSKVDIVRISDAYKCVSVSAFKYVSIVIITLQRSQEECTGGDRYYVYHNCRSELTCTATDGDSGVARILLWRGPSDNQANCAYIYIYIYIYIYNIYILYIYISSSSPFPTR